MKIVHTSDLHIGSPLTARLSADKVRERKGELILTFEKMVEEALYSKARLFIIAGDLFDSEKITKSVAERVLGIIEKNASIDFLYLPGNHEKQALIESGVSLPGNLKVFGEEWTYFTYDYVTVAGRTELTSDMFDTLTLSNLKTNIVVLHGALAECRSGGEYIGVHDAAEKGIDYLALGHYHSYGKAYIDDVCQAVYCGTPEGRGFDEVGTKGFVMMDADGKRVYHRFVPFSRRTLRIVDVDITGAMKRLDIEDRAEEALREIPAYDLVRLRLTGARHPELFTDAESLKSKWDMSFYHFEVKDETVTRINPADYKNDKSLKGEFIRLVMSKNNLSETEKDKIIRTGLAALMGEIDEI